MCALCAIAVSAEGGRRLVATCTIDPGAIVISEPPVISASGSLAGSYRAWALVRALVDDAEKLTWFSKAGFKRTSQVWDAEDASIARGIARDRAMDTQRVQDLYFRVATNHMGFFNGSGHVDGSGLFETLCFSNHSCAPNTIPAAPGPYVRGTALRAIEMIAADEEVTWSYLWPQDLSMLSRKHRQQLLHQCFGFRCRCARCIRTR